MSIRVAVPRELEYLPSATSAPRANSTCSTGTGLPAAASAIGPKTYFAEFFTYACFGKYCGNVGKLPDGPESNGKASDNSRNSAADIAVMRVMCRRGFEMDFASLLLRDFKIALRFLETHPAPEIKVHEGAGFHH